nr:tocopherol cyclase family protein [Maliibacterium massiliense]
MHNFHGAHKRSRFFEGWYLKHQQGEHTVAFIPAFHVDAQGKKSASLQVVTDEGAWNLTFDAAAFAASRHRFRVRVGDSLFCTNGARLDIDADGLRVTGLLHYDAFTPLAADIMGPFRFFSMQCNHGVLSMAHALSGSLRLNGRKLDFTGGTGYIEKDWGRSFPKHYLWTQCCQQDTSAMLSVADIPVLGGRFTGCIAVVQAQGRQYRLASYRGARIARYDAGGAALRQGDMRLEATLLAGAPHALRAPQQGGMTRTIEESPACRVRYRFSVQERVVLDFTNARASFEYACPTEDI